MNTVAFKTLPSVIEQTILDFLDAKEVAIASRVSKSWEIRCAEELKKKKNDILKSFHPAIQNTILQNYPSNQIQEIDTLPPKHEYAFTRKIMKSDTNDLWIGPNDFEQLRKTSSSAPGITFAVHEPDTRPYMKGLLSIYPGPTKSETYFKLIRSDAPDWEPVNATTRVFSTHKSIAVLAKLFTNKTYAGFVHVLPKEKIDQKFSDQERSEYRVFFSFLVAAAVVACAAASYFVYNGQSVGSLSLQ